MGASPRPDYGPLVEVPYLGTTVLAYANRPASLSLVLREAAGRWSDRTAVESPEGSCTYSELDRVVDALAAGLVAAGVGEGDTVAVALEHGLRAYALPFATSRSGARALLLGADRPAATWRQQMARVAPSLAIASPQLLGRLGEAADGVAVCDAREAMPLVGGGRPTEAEPDEDRPLVLIGTSGTTGVPKTTAVTSRGLIHAALGYAQLLELGQDERTLVVLPLSYIGPLSAQTTAMALVGGCAVLPASTEAAASLDVLAARGITHLDAVPAWLTPMTRAASVPPLPAWRTLIYGGAPMPAETVAWLARSVPGLALWDVWGLSETHGPATALRYDRQSPAPPGTVGRPLPGIEVRAHADDGSVLPAGETGELAVRGANVTPGYVDDPHTTAEVLREGWLATGDLGTIAADGTVRVLDRLKDVILRGGANVFSVEVEQVLCSAPGVAEAGVYGVADGLGGEAVAAAVVLLDGAQLDIAGLRRLVAERLGTPAVPRFVAAVGALPRNATGKIDKLRLRNPTS